MRSQNNPLYLDEQEKKYYLSLWDRNFWRVLAESGQDIFFLLPYLKQNLNSLTSSLIFFILGLVGLFLTPIAVGHMIDLLSLGASGVNWKMGFLFLTLALGMRFLFEALFKITFLSAGQQIIRQLREDAFQKVYALPQAFYDLNASPRILSRAVGDITQTETILNVGVFSILKDLAMVVGAIVSVFFIHPVIALPMLLVLIVLFYALAYVAAQGRVANLRTRSLAARSSASLADYLNNQESVIAHDWKTFITNNFSRIARIQFLVAQGSLLRWASFTAVHAVGLGVVQCSVLLLGIYYIDQGSLTVGNLVACVSFTAMMVSPFFDLSTKVQEVLSGLASLGRLNSLFSLPSIKTAIKNETINHLDSVNWDKPIEITFNQITFGYNPETPLFHNFQLSLMGGKATAIMGKTGRGKTTLINMILRLYPIQSGEICINQKNIDELNLEELYRKVAYVSQEIFLFKSSIRENLLLGKKINDDVLLSILTSLQFPIEEFPGGLDFEISSQGQELSTGQKQLLTLARLLLKNPGLIILDEGTSHLDEASESRFYLKLRELFAQTTILIIAHRKSTADYVDQVVNLDEINMLGSDV
jgi:ABC-type multidrug transport system fused ATPase/permease subunit